MHKTVSGSDVEKFVADIKKDENHPEQNKCCDKDHMDLACTDRLYGRISNNSSMFRFTYRREMREGLVQINWPATLLDILVGQHMTVGHIRSKLRVINYLGTGCRHQPLPASIV